MTQQPWTGGGRDQMQGGARVWRLAAAVAARVLLGSFVLPKLFFSNPSLDSVLDVLVKIKALLLVQRKSTKTVTVEKYLCQGC